ncbi:MAG: AAA family ATPase [Planctomycetota bacterium]|nr:AAA family ATPase [Planctomycetota bacterium]
MKFHDVEITGFGIWSNLEVRDLSPEVTVFYGPNEAGKTTIMQAIRGVLYGYTPWRRQRYLPPVHGGTGGGALRVGPAQGLTTIRRDALPNGSLGELSVTLPGGAIGGESHLRDLLLDVDEPTYSNIFSVGLHELQELSTLNDIDAASALYDLSSGLDRVSLNEVMRELTTSRMRLLSPTGEKSQITELIGQRDTLRNEIHIMITAGRRYWRLAEENHETDELFQKTESELAQVTAELRKMDSAAAARDAYQQRLSIEQQLAEFGPLGDFPPDGLARLAEIARGMQSVRRRRRALKQKVKDLRLDRETISVNETLWRQAPRIAAISEHESWIVSLEQQINESETAVAHLEKQLATQRSQSGLPAELGTNIEQLTSRLQSTLRPPAAGIRDARQRLKQVKAEWSANQKKLTGSRDDVETELLSRGETELAAALEKQGQLVSQYRRRLQLDDRLDQMGRHRAELDEDHEYFVERQVMPLWQLCLLGAIVVVGLGMAIVGLLLPATSIGNWGGTMAFLGVAAAAAAVYGYFRIDSLNADRLEATRKQLMMLDKQLAQAVSERDDLDEVLPEGGGSLTSRLHAAEADLATLEQLLSRDARRASAEEEVNTTRQRAKIARDDWQKARRRWESALKSLKLPETLKPNQVRQITGQAKRLAELQHQLDQAKQERDRRKRELATLVTRIEQLAADAGWESTAGATNHRVSLVEQLRKLRREVTLQEQQAAKRDELAKLLAQARRRYIKYGRRGRKLLRQRRALLIAARVADEAEFKQVATHRSRADELSRRKLALSREIATALAGIGTEDELRGWLTALPEGLQQQREQLIAQQTKLNDRIRALSDQRADIGLQRNILADDRNLSLKQLELGSVEQRLKEALARWQTVALTEQLLHSIRDEYERDRQPETLIQASEYLVRMTEGQYRRVWTPLGENILLVEDRDGQNLSVDVLSRGTREQLFLSLRLALVSMLSRRGKRLPMVLDDVLVNFDTHRARAAAQVFCDFAAAGHQLVIFTCHEHIAHAFRKLRADVRRLPDNSDTSRKILLPGEIESLPAYEPPPEPVVEAPRRRKPKPAKEPPPPVEILPEPVIEEVEIQVEEEPAEIVPAIWSTQIERFVSEETTMVIVDDPQEASWELPEETVAVPFELVELAVEKAPEPPPKPAPKPARRRRADPAHRFKPLPMIERRGWNAEEFDGELEDQVNTQLVRDNRWFEESAAQNGQHGD